MNFTLANSGVPDRRRKPDLGARAANDSQTGPGEQLPPSLRELSQLAKTCRAMVDAPQDLPLEGLALEGLARAVSALAELHPEYLVLARRIDEVRREQPLGVIEGATLLALQRRLGRHQLFAAAIAIARASPNGEVDPVVLQTMGARFVLRIFRDVQPSRTALAVAISAISNSSGEHAMTWTAKARARAFAVADRQLQEAILASPEVAASYGFSESLPRVVRSTNPVEAFNREFRRRSENLEDYASGAMVAAAGGTGTLSPNLLRESGAMLLSMAEAGDDAAALVCVEVVSHLTSQIALQLPLKTGSQPPTGALAWLDLTNGEYCYTLHKVRERAARPQPGTTHLYEDTVQVVSIRLTPVLAEHFRARARALVVQPRTLDDLLGAVGHHPRSAVVGAGVYRVTARRLQESVPALLIAAGHHRWPVALVTNSFFLTSRGRPVYGACHSQAIDRTAAAACEALGWPAPRPSDRCELVGSFTAVKPAAVRRAFEFLCQRADAAGEVDSIAAAIAILTRHASWMAALLALALALRRWLEYALDGDELRQGDACRVLDKDVHAQQGLAIPLVGLVGQAMKGWDALVERVALALEGLVDRRSVALGGRLRTWLREGRKGMAVFTVDAADRLEPVGYQVWNDALPENLRIRPNFGRQLWPQQLMERGIEQLLIDVLTRHQIDGLYVGSSNRVNVIDGDVARLRAAMEEVVDRLLQIALPTALRGI